MTELTMVGGAIVALVVLVIVLKFGKVILNKLALAGLLALVGGGVLVYLRVTDAPGQVQLPAALPQVEAVQDVAAVAAPTATPEPTGWLGKATNALGDVATVVRALKPAESKPAPVPEPVIVRVPQQSSSSGALGTFCAGSFAMLALGATGVAGWFYYKWQRGEGNGTKLFEQRWEAQQREPRSRQLISQQEQQQWQYPTQWRQVPPQTYWMPQDNPQDFNGSDWGW